MEPFEIDFSTVGAALATFFQLLRAILEREQGVIAAIHDQPGVLQLSFIVVLVAGLSEAVGQSVVLFVNEVKPRRFVISLIITAILFVGGYVLWVLSIWLVALVLFQHEVSLISVIRAVGLGYAPLVFSFLALMPYFGTAINTMLYFWAFTAVVSAVSITLDLTRIEAIVASLAGALLILRIRATFGKPLVKVTRRIRNLAAGKRLVLKVQQAVEARSFDVFMEDTPPANHQPPNTPSDDRR